MKNAFIALLVLFLIISFIVWISPSDQNTKDSQPQNATQQKKQDILYTVICPKDGVVIRIGPGTQYKKDSSGTLFKGEKLHVLEEKNGWVRFRVTPKDVGWSGWTKQSLLDIKKEDRLSDLDKGIKLIVDTGLLKKLTPQLNEAFVDPSTWNKLEFDTKEDIGRNLAFYSGREKGTNLNWVDIRDVYSGKKLAKYSESWGFKVY